MKLWFKILLGLTASLALAVAASLVLINFAERSMQEEVVDSTNLISKEVMNEIDRTIYHRLEQTQQYSSSLVDEPKLLGSNEKFDNLKNRQNYIKQKDQQWISGEATSSVAEVLSNNLAQEIKSEFQRKEFYQEKEGLVLFPEVFVTNKYGAVIAASNKTSDYYQADEEWWQNAKNQGVYVGGMRKEESTGRLAMDLAVRIEDNSGNFLGVLIAVLNGEEVGSLLEDLKEKAKSVHDKLKESGEIHLLNSNDEVIYCTADHKFSEKYHYDYCQEQPNGKCKKFVITEDDTGKEILLTHAHSQGHQHYSGRDWSLIMQQRVDEAFKPIKTMRANLLWVILTASVIIFVSDWLVARTIAAPEEKLRKKKRQLEKFARLAEGREKRMIELKKRINKLERKLGKDPSFDIEESGGRLKEKSSGK